MKWYDVFLIVFLMNICFFSTVIFDEKNSPITALGSIILGLLMSGFLILLDKLKFVNNYLCQKIRFKILSIFSYCSTDYVFLSLLLLAFSLFIYIGTNDDIESSRFMLMSTLTLFAQSFGIFLYLRASTWKLVMQINWHEDLCLNKFKLLGDAGGYFWVFDTEDRKFAICNYLTDEYAIQNFSSIRMYYITTESHLVNVDPVDGNYGVADKRIGVVIVYLAEPDDTIRFEMGESSAKKWGRFFDDMGFKGCVHKNMDAVF